jgi:hypothetical protein
MAKYVYMRIIRRTRNRRQAYVLMLVGIICLLLAWLVHPDQGAVPIGVFVLGLGMLLSTALNPYRLLIAACLTTTLGFAVFLVFRGWADVLTAYILGLGVGLLAVAFAVRRGLVGKGAMSPAIFVIGVGIVEYLLAKHMTPAGFIPFMLSLWLPGIVLPILGVLYWLTSSRV